MKGFILLALAVFAALQTVESACSPCRTMKWVNCDGAPCTCQITLDDSNRPAIDCEKLVSKCFLMKAEMYRRKMGQDVRINIGGKPHEDAIMDNDGIYNPDCENDGKFKAKQCNNTDECWCVNSAGVRRTDKGDKNMNCSKLLNGGSQKLDLNKIVVYYVDEERPTITMQYLTGGIIAVIVVVVLVVVLGLLALVSAQFKVKMPKSPA
uniref:Epithelial cell adhesion molecule n=1 Tax=Xiphophorus couchianus TaxID=32473 RepID=A0A3B5LDG8_9TELE